MKTIMTFKGEPVMVDDSDFEWLSQYGWSLSTKGYVRRRENQSDGSSIQLLMHRFVLGIPYGDPRIVDHANGIKTDNRRSNLRICTKAQNGYNQKEQRNNTSGFKGVTFHKVTGRFMAQIRSDGKKKYLGTFDTAQEAHDAYCVAALELHGEFANFGNADAIRALSAPAKEE